MRQGEHVTFDLVLARVPSESRTSVTRVLRELKPSLNLAQAEELMKGLPQKIFEGMSEDEVRAAKEKLEQVGADVRLYQITPL
jgi:ribosomal protein L7/L12